MRAEDNSQMTTLSPPSFQIVMSAIKHAKIKGHCQVQPLHVAAALLDPLTRSIALHNACLQSLKDPTHTLKCDALDLCFKVALDRLPVITDPDKCKDQSMSNALGAALKRAHANERRGTPEQSLQPLLAVKTGIAHLTISILDDPSVSRVFREAGFSSTAVKNNMEEAVAKAALAGPVHAPTLDNPGSLRRMQYPISPYSTPRLDGVQFRNSYFPGPYATGDPSNNHAKPLERGAMNGNGMDSLADREGPYFGSSLPKQDSHAAARSFGSTAPKFLQQSPLTPKRYDQGGMLGRSGDSPSLRAPPPFRHEGDVSNIVQLFGSGPKKRNPVLVGESGANLILKELGQRLLRKEVSLLKGVVVIDLPFTSLSVGILSQEAFEQKLAKLKRDVEGCLQGGGGAIISVGDVQWLLEPCHHLASLVLQELQQLMSSNAYNRLWLLASASPKTLERCLANKLSVVDSLGLHPVMLAPDPVSAFQSSSRLGSHYSAKSGEVSFASQLGNGAGLAAVKPAATQNGLEKFDCCLDCDINFQQECSAFIKEEQTLYLGSGPSPAHPKLPWMRSKVKTSPPFSVKEEENLISHRIDELRQKWQHHCSIQQHPHRPTSLTVSSIVSRDHSTSPVAEVVSPHETNSRLSLPMLPTPVASKWAPQPVRVSTEKPVEPLHARMAKANNMTNFLSFSKPSLRPMNRESEARNGNDLGGSSIGWMRSNSSSGGASSPTLSMKPSMMVGGKLGNSGPVLTDLALGRSGLAPVAPQPRNLREEGEHPLYNSRLQQQQQQQTPASNPKSAKMLSQSGMMRSSDAENLNGLCWNLSNAVAWQKEAVGAVAATVVKCRSGEGGKTGVYARTDTWLMFLGADRVGKREMARALAKIVFGREDNLILLSGLRTGSSGQSPPITGTLMVDSNGVQLRGKTTLDRLAEALLRKPFSVVFLEDIERADSVLKKGLTRAMERGRLADSSGREVSLANVIVVMTGGAGANFLTNQQNPQAETAMEFDEDKLSGLCPRDVRVLTDNTPSGNVLLTKGQGFSVVESIKRDQEQEREAVKEDEKPSDSILIFGSPMFKRKADDENSNGLGCPPSKVLKREECSPNRGLSLDLNLSAEENLSEDGEPCITEEPCETSAPKSLEELTSKVIESARGECPAELFALLDAAVLFKPFNLTGLRDWVVEVLERAVEDVMHTAKVPVEVDRSLLEVMLAFAWENFSNRDVFQGWVDNVLKKTLSGLLEKGSLAQDAVLKVTSVKRNALTSPDTTDSSSFPRQLLPTAIEVYQ